jgi:hypothetical protein
MGSHGSELKHRRMIGRPWLAPRAGAFFCALPLRPGAIRGTFPLPLDFPSYEAR